MEEMNGQVSDDRAVEIIGDDSETSVLMVKVAALEQENIQLVREKDVIEKKIGELKKSVEEVVVEKEKLVQELEESKAEIRTLGSVAARAADLEGEVARLQHDLISTTSELSDVNGELNEVKEALDELRKKDGVKGKEFEAVVIERDLLIEKLGKWEAKEEQYLSDMNEKEKLIGALREKVDEFRASVQKLQKEYQLKYEKLNQSMEKEREVYESEGKAGGLMSGMWEVTGYAALAMGLCGLICYFSQEKRT